MEFDPVVLLDWLNPKNDESRDMQISGLEQLCMMLLMSDNVDRCFDKCPPRTFIPALCNIMTDETAPESTLEACARAITYYLDVSTECTRRIVADPAAVKAICLRLVKVDMSDRISKDLCEQCIKVLELICNRESGAVFDAGGLTCTITFIEQNGSKTHRDILHSAMSVVTRLCTKMEPSNKSLKECIEALAVLLKHEDDFVANGALKCFASLADRFNRRGIDPAPLGHKDLLNDLLNRLNGAGTKPIPLNGSINGTPQSQSFNYSSMTPGSITASSPGSVSHMSANTPDNRSSTTNITTVVSLLCTLCKASPNVTMSLMENDLLGAINNALSGDDRCILDVMRLVDILLVLLFEGRRSLNRPSAAFGGKLSNYIQIMKRNEAIELSSQENLNKQLTDIIRNKDTISLITNIENGKICKDYTDEVGQTLLNWASAFGTIEMIEYLCSNGADINKGMRSSSLHYAACFGRAEIVKLLLQYGANPELRDEDSKTALDKARERGDEQAYVEIVQILEAPGEYMGDLIMGDDDEVVEEEEDEEEEDMEEDEDEDEALAAGEGGEEVDMDFDQQQQQGEQPIEQQDVVEADLEEGEEEEGEEMEIDIDDDDDNEPASEDCGDQHPLHHNMDPDHVRSSGYAVALQQSLSMIEPRLPREPSSFSPILVTSRPGSPVPEGGVATSPTMVVMVDTGDEPRPQDGDVARAMAAAGAGGHREAQSNEVLQASQPVADTITASAANANSINIKLLCEPEETEEEIQAKQANSVRSMQFISIIMPAMCRVYDNAMLPSIRKSTSSLLRKVIAKITGDQLQELCNIPFVNFAPHIVDVCSSVFESEEDDNKFVSLQMLDGLISKCPAVFIDQMQRLGLFIKIKALLNEFTSKDVKQGEQNKAIDTAGSSSSSKANPVDDNSHPNTLIMNKPYHWNEWLILRCRDCIYLWNESCAIDLSNGSNGWFRYLIDGKLITMYSSGAPEGHSDNNADNRSEFITKLRKAFVANEGIPTKAILENRSQGAIEVGNWSLNLSENSELVIENIADGEKNTQKTLLRENYSGFEFESNRNTKHKFVASMSFARLLNANGKFRSTLKGKLDQNKQEQIHVLAQGIYNYIEEIELKPRSIVLRLAKIVDQIKAACKSELKSLDSPCSDQTLESVFTDLWTLLRDDYATLSSFEIDNSGLVAALFTCLSNNCVPHSFESRRDAFDRIRVFKKVFSSNNDQGDGTPVGVLLIRKLINVIENIESLTMHHHDTANSNSLACLSRKINLTLKLYKQESPELIDRTGCTMKIEPCVSVFSLNKYLKKMVSRQWYDNPRQQLHFYKVISCVNFKCLDLTYVSDFDTNGLFYYLGTNANTVNEWVNPITAKLVTMSYSGGKNLSHGKFEDVLSRDTTPANCHSRDDKNAWISIDLGVFIIPTAYTLRHSTGYGKSALRTWALEGSVDGHKWSSLSEHDWDESLVEPGSTATWPIVVCDEEQNSGETSSYQGIRHVRIQQKGYNSSKNMHYLSLSGFEIYGRVTSICNDLGRAIKEIQRDIRKARRLIDKNVMPLLAVGLRVIRGPDWKWMDQDYKVTRRAASRLKIAANSATPKTPSTGSQPGASGSQAGASGSQAGASGSQAGASGSQAGASGSQAGSSGSQAGASGSQAGTSGSQAGLIGSKLKPLHEGTITALDSVSIGWVSVKWDYGVSNIYRMGAQNRYDLTVSPNNKFMPKSKASTSASASTSSKAVVRPGSSKSRLSASSSTSSARHPTSSNVSGSRLGPRGDGYAATRKRTGDDIAAEEGGGGGDVGEPSSSSTADISTAVPVVEQPAPPMCSLAQHDPEDEDVENDAPLRLPASTNTTASTLHTGRHCCSTPALYSAIANGDSTTSAANSRPESVQEHVEPTQTSSTNNLAVAEDLSSSSDDAVLSVSVPNLNEGLDPHLLQSFAMMASREASEASEEGGSSQRSSLYSRVTNSQGLLRLALSNDSNNFASNILSASFPSLNDSQADSNDSNGLSSLMSAATMQDITSLSEVLSRSLNTNIDSEMLLACRDSQFLSDFDLFNHHHQNEEDDDDDDDDDDDEDDDDEDDDDEEDEDDADEEEEEVIDIEIDNEVNDGEMDASPEGSDVPVQLEASEVGESQEDDEEEEEEEMLDIDDLPNDITGDMQGNENDNDRLSLKEALDCNLDSMYRSSGNDAASSTTKSVRKWDEDILLKKNFKALIPPFDPRPGHDNVKQTQDFAIPPPSKESEVEEDANYSVANEDEELCLVLSISGTPYEVVMSESSNTVFYYIQQLYHSKFGKTTPRKGKDAKKYIFDLKYTICYRLIQKDLSEKAVKRKLPFSVSSSTCSSTAMDLLCYDPAKAVVQLTGDPKVDLVLRLLQLLYAISRDEPIDNNLYHPQEVRLYIPVEEFYSKSFTNKIVQQMQDPLILVSKSYPSWCINLMTWTPMLFSFETRHRIFTSCAFGSTRSLLWLQSKRENRNETRRGPTVVPRDSRTADYQMGRLKHDRIAVPRKSETLLDWARQVMHIHASRKSILEIEFQDEEGTGLGPTLEFYSLVAANLQRKTLGLWLCDDNHPDDLSRQVDIGDGVKPVGYYVQRSCGLFPAPMPQDLEATDRVVKYFRFMGALFAKCMQDSRLIDIPLSTPFLKLICMGDSAIDSIAANALSDNNVNNREYRQMFRSLTCADGEGDYCEDDDPVTMAMVASMTSSSISDNDPTLNEKAFDSSIPTRIDLCQQILHAKFTMDSDPVCTINNKEDKIESPWFAGLLTHHDFELVDPHRAHVIKQLRTLSSEKNEILDDASLTNDEKNIRLANITWPNSKARLCDLGLTFEFNPSSAVYDYKSVDLIEGGSEVEVTLENIEEYIDAVTDFCLNTGIRRQMEAFKVGFSSVFPMERLFPFNPIELQTILSGDQMPQWTREQLLSYTEPKLGYTKESPGFVRFVNVLMEMSADERRSFLQFSTGCPSLPPGGFVNLHPHLTVVRKVDGCDSSYPSVNTCVHYLKLPEYSSEEILRERLLAATREKGFHLN